MSTTAVRRTIVIALLISLITVISIGIALFNELGKSVEPRGNYSKTADAIYATNTQVSIFNFQTMEVERWTKTPTLTPTPNRQ